MDGSGADEAQTPGSKSKQIVRHKNMNVIRYRVYRVLNVDTVVETTKPDLLSSDHQLK